jgi:hypothetical protein
MKKILILLVLFSMIWQPRLNLLPLLKFAGKKGLKIIGKKGLKFVGKKGLRFIKKKRLGRVVKKLFKKAKRTVFRRNGKKLRRSSQKKRFFKFKRKKVPRMRQRPVRKRNIRRQRSDERFNNVDDLRPNSRSSSGSMHDTSYPPISHYPSGSAPSSASSPLLGLASAPTSPQASNTFDQETNTAPTNGNETNNPISNNFKNNPKQEFVPRSPKYETGLGDFDSGSSDGIFGMNDHSNPMRDKMHNNTNGPDNGRFNSSGDLSESDTDGSFRESSGSRRYFEPEYKQDSETLPIDGMPDLGINEPMDEMGSMGDFFGD